MYRYPIILPLDVNNCRYEHSNSACKESPPVQQPGLVDFAVRLVHSVQHLPNGQEKFRRKFKLQTEVLLEMNFWRLVRMILGQYIIVRACLIEGQGQNFVVVFFALCNCSISAGFCTVQCRSILIMPSNMQIVSLQLVTKQRCTADVYTYLTNYYTCLILLRRING